MSGLPAKHADIRTEFDLWITRFVRWLEWSKAITPAGKTSASGSTNTQTMSECDVYKESDEEEMFLVDYAPSINEKGFNPDEPPPPRRGSRDGLAIDVVSNTPLIFGGVGYYTRSELWHMAGMSRIMCSFVRRSF